MLSRKQAAGAALAIVLAGAGGLAVAQQTPPGDGPRGRWQPPSPELVQRMIDGRLAGTKAALELTPEQERLWPALEDAIRQNSAERMRLREEMRQARRDKQAPRDMVERLETMSGRLEARAAAIKRLTEALKPLYATLSDDQKQVLRMSIADAMRARRGFGGWHHHRG